MAITCCYKCGDRYLGCHDKCETYQNQKKQHELMKAKQREEKRYRELCFLGVERNKKAGQR